MKLSLIVAMSENHVIGKNNQLPWHMPADLAYFKSKTQGKTILMGRKTYESIGRPLPNRENWVISRNTEFKADGVNIFNSMDLAIKTAEEKKLDELVIIGGASIYQAVLDSDKVDLIYLTIIHEEIMGDAYFPELSDIFVETDREHHNKDGKNQYDYSFLVFERRVLK